MLLVTRGTHALAVDSTQLPSHPAACLSAHMRCCCVVRACRYTWLWSYDNPTHADMQPLPFDVNYNAKPAFYKMLALLTGD